MKKFIILNIVFLISLSDLYSNTFNYDSSDGKDIMSVVGEKGKKQLKCKKTACLANSNQRICGGRITFLDSTKSGYYYGRVNSDECKVKIYTYVDIDLPFALMGKLSKRYKKIMKVEVTDKYGKLLQEECRVECFGGTGMCKYSNEEKISEIEIFRYEDQSLVFTQNLGIGMSFLSKYVFNMNNNCNYRGVWAEVVSSPCAKYGCVEWETDALDILSIMPDIGLEAINTDLIEY